MQRHSHLVNPCRPLGTPKWKLQCFNQQPTIFSITVRSMRQILATIRVLTVLGFPSRVVCVSCELSLLLHRIFWRCYHSWFYSCLSSNPTVTCPLSCRSWRRFPCPRRGPSSLALTIWRVAVCCRTALLALLEESKERESRRPFSSLAF